MKAKQFILTCKESKELKATGRTVHAYGGIGYNIEMDEQGNAHCTGLSLLDSVDFEIVVRK